MTEKLRYHYAFWFVAHFIGVHILYTSLDLVYGEKMSLYFNIGKLILLAPVGLFIFNNYSYDFIKLAHRFVGFFFAIIYVSIFLTWDYAPITAICLPLSLFPLLFIMPLKKAFYYNIFFVLTLLSFPVINSFKHFQLLSNSSPQYLLLYNLLVIISSLFFISYNLYFLLKLERFKSISIPAEFLEVEKDIIYDQRDQNTNDSGEDDIDKLNEVYNAILDYFDKEQPWRNSEFNLSQLTDTINSNTKYVSTALNKLAGKNFNTFVNEYRIEQVKNALRNNEHKAYTIKYIYSEAGFNSQSSFNRIFKQLEGMSPQEFINRYVE